MGRSKARADSTGSWLRVATWVLGLTIAAAPAIAEDDLLDMSLEELMNIEVTSVSKKAENKNDAAAAVTVITAEDIRRHGFTSVPEALRMVPGVQVAQIDASRWAISIRGLRQEFSNTLLVMIDGRSVYTPLFGGVIWNEQNFAIDDIARIEVVRGPGGTIWGANAVNGVINIISKTAAETQGARAHVLGGTQQYGFGARYGGEFSDDTQYRFSVEGQRTEDFDFDQDYAGNDEYRQLRLGFRSDTQLSPNRELSIHADYFDIDREAGQGIPTPGFFLPITGFNKLRYKQRGGSAVANFKQSFDDGSRLQAKAYYDRVYRDTTSKEDSHTVDLDLQYSADWTENLSVVTGANYRFWTTHVRTGSSTIGFQDSDEDFHLGSSFIQLRLDVLDDKVAFIAGTKLSVNSWSGFEYQPSGRFVVKPLDGHTLWGAVSRAVRTPTFTDRDIAGSLGPVGILGNDEFRSEELLSYEAGYRYFGLDWMTAEVSAFWSDYEDFSSLLDLAAAPPIPGPLLFVNGGNVKVRGVEVEVTVVPSDRVRLTVGYSFLDFDENAPASIISTPLKHTHPQHQFQIRSVVDLPADLEFDAAFYYVEGLRGTTPVLQGNNVRAYHRLDLRLGWQPTDWLEVALVGQNLLDPRHAEFNDVQFNQSTQVPRSGYAKVIVDF